jgi:hypothetical protein
MKKKDETKDIKKSARELTALVVATVNHPDCPEDLVDGILRAIGELNDNGNVAMRAGYVEAVLAQHFEDEAEGGSR